jgi:ubiquinone/menaquinone biosynthesis C-methylase UbiE
VQAFVTARELAARMEQVGWRDVRYRLLALGTVAIHTARRI